MDLKVELLQKACAAQNKMTIPHIIHVAYLCVCQLEKLMAHTKNAAQRGV